MQKETIIRRQPEPLQILLLGVRSSGRAVCDESWDHARGYVDRYNFYWGKSGTVRYRVDGKAFCNHAGELLIFPPGVTMSPETKLRSCGEYNWMTLDAQDAGKTLAHLGLKLYTSLNAGPCPVAMFGALRSELSQMECTSQFDCELIGFSIILKAARHIAFGHPPLTIDPIAAKCRKIFEDEYSDCSMNIDAVAQRLQVNRSRLSRIFKAAFELPPSEYLSRIRIRNAMRLLQSYEQQYPVAKVAAMSGFADPAYFSRRFKAMIGFSPQQLRKEI